MTLIQASLIRGLEIGAMDRLFHNSFKNLGLLNLQLSYSVWRNSFLLYTYSHHLSLAGITDTKTPIFASCAKQASVVVPADVIDEVWVIFHCDQWLARAHVPDYNQIITACDTHIMDSMDQNKGTGKDGIHFHLAQRWIQEACSHLQWEGCCGQWGASWRCPRVWSGPPAPQWAHWWAELECDLGSAIPTEKKREILVINKHRGSIQALFHLMEARHKICQDYGNISVVKN